MILQETSIGMLLWEYVDENTFTMKNHSHNNIIIIIGTYVELSHHRNIIIMISQTQLIRSNLKINAYAYLFLNSSLKLDPILRVEMEPYIDLVNNHFSTQIYSNMEQKVSGRCLSQYVVPLLNYRQIIHNIIIIDNNKYYYFITYTTSTVNLHCI